ncbi:MAG: S41 family peptidase [Verrucomicrobiota bacterium]
MRPGFLESKRRLFLAGWLFISFFVSTTLSQDLEGGDERYRSSLLFAHVLEMVRSQYVDSDQIDYNRLTHAALDGMLSSLDPYCEFLDAEQYLDIRSETKGIFGGVGVYVGVQKNRNLVINMPVPGGPAFKAGLLPGDLIVKIDEKDAKGLSLSEAIRLMRGRPGDPVALVIYRPTTRQTLEMSIFRAVINVPTVRDSAIISEFSQGEHQVGYMRILQFGENTIYELDDALKELYGKGMTSLIIDLRNNPGGLLEAAVQVAGRFLEPGQVVAYTDGRHDGEGRNYYHAEGDRHDLALPLVLLVNQHSASAAEIVAGALKDLGRAVLVGETSYGKGSVQTIQPVENSQDDPVAIRLTTAKYYTPSQQVIHQKGVSPHVTVPVSRAEDQAILRKQNRHVLSPEEQSELANVEDRPLARAITVLKGLMIFRERHPNIQAQVEKKQQQLSHAGFGY